MITTIYYFQLTGDFATDVTLLTKFLQFGKEKHFNISPWWWKGGRGVDPTEFMTYMYHEYPTDIHRHICLYQTLSDYTFGLNGWDIDAFNECYAHTSKHIVCWKPNYQYPQEISIF